MKKNIAFIHVGSLGSYKILSDYSDYCLFLATLAQQSSVYTSFINEISKKKYTILDTGVFELTLGTEKKEVIDRHFLEMCLSLNVHEVVCPDSPYNPTDSLKRTLAFIKEWKKVTSKKPSLMIVPHGNTLNEWYQNLLILCSEAPGCTIGIPRILASITHNQNHNFRIYLAQRIKKLLPNHTIHLLGGGENLLLEIISIKHTNGVIRSLDTTFIHRYANSKIDALKAYAPPLELRKIEIVNGFEAKAKNLLELFSCNTF